MRILDTPFALVISGLRRLLVLRRAFVQYPRHYLTPKLSSLWGHPFVQLVFESLVFVFASPLVEIESGEIATDRLLCSEGGTP